MNNNRGRGFKREREGGGGGGYSISSPEKEGLIREGSLRARSPFGGYRKLRSPKWESLLEG